MTNDEKKLNVNEVENVSGGERVGSGKNIGACCKHYECAECGAHAAAWEYAGKMCLSIVVNHKSGCSVPANPLYKNGTIRDCCGNCRHNTGFATCDIPND